MPCTRMACGCSLYNDPNLGPSGHLASRSATTKAARSKKGRESIMCQCKSLPDGRTIVCDACASKMLMMLTDVVPDQAVYATELPQDFTQVEYAGMMAAVNL